MSLRELIEQMQRPLSIPPRVYKHRRRVYELPQPNHDGDGLPDVFIVSGSDHWRAYEGEG